MVFNRFFIKSVRDSGRVVNSAIVRAAAKGIVLSHDRSLLFENGGHIELTKSWAKFLLKRMNMVKRKGTMSKKTFDVENFTQEKDKYSGTCVIRHLSFPTSCDFRQEFHVPKYFFNILC